MTAMKKLLGSLILAGSLLTAQNVMAESKQAAETAQMETAKSTAVITNKVNINTANADELKRVLIGIGQKKAEAIVQYREQHGAFTHAEQLLEVQGFGKATLEKNKDRILF